MPAPRVYEIGERYGRLTVIARREPPQQQVHCRCDCGAETSVLHNNLGKGHTTSCGCLWLETIRTHGHSNNRSRTYIAWQNMIARGTRDYEIYARYRERGVTVCDRWRGSFELFLADMGECPPLLTLDRIDNEGNYEPGNCRWATRTEQNYNKTPNKRLTVCRRGHDVSKPESYYESKDGCRSCKLCQRMTPEERRLFDEGRLADALH